MSRLINFKSQKPKFDPRVITHDEYNRVMRFINEGEIIGSFKRSSDELKSMLEEINYDKENHFNYTFMYYVQNSNEYGPDIRHVHIKELNKGISIL